MLQLMVIALVIGWFARQYTFKNRLKWKQRAETLKGVGRYLAADGRAVLRKPVQQSDVGYNKDLYDETLNKLSPLTDAEWDAFMEELDDE